jgi:hypothetical protein
MTKIKLNLHDLVTQALNGDATRLPAALRISASLEANAIEECEVDIDDLLRDNRLIAHIWSVEDVRNIRPDLNDDQAWEVLRRIDNDVDSSIGISWDDIERMAREMYRDDPDRRVERCDKALSAYGNDLSESNLIDLIADAMHWCKANVCDFDAVLETARSHFGAETSDEGRLRSRRALRATPRSIDLSEGAFQALFPLIGNHLNPNAGWRHPETFGCLFETFGRERDFVVKQDPRRVWTLVEGDNDTELVLSGFHSVNRLGFLISSVPVPEGVEVCVTYAREEADHDDLKA